MPYKDPEKRKEYREKNKEKINQRKREIYQRDKEKIIQQQKLRTSKYLKTDKGKKSSRIANWKNILEIKCDNYDELYEKYIDTEYCELCNVKLTEDKIRKSTTRCLDHDHQTGLVRNIVCHSCNVKRG